MKQKAKKYINSLYIDYGDLNYKAEEQIKQAFIDGMNQQLILSGVSNRRGLLIADMVKMIEGYTDEEINIVCDQRNEIYGSNL